MQTYVILRRGAVATADQLDHAFSRLRAFEEKPHAIQAEWIRSYTLRENDGRFGLVCVFRADSTDALREHAALVELPTDEILPVGATVLVRPDAPTMVYMIRRRTFWKTAADLERSARISRRIGDEMAGRVSWIRTYAVQEDNGMLGTVCIYQGVDVQSLKEHAERVGMPADEIIPVIGRVVYRDDPQDQPAPAAEVAA